MFKPTLLLIISLWLTSIATATVRAATPIACGQSINGSLTTASTFSVGRGSGFYANQYTFTATAGKTVTISLTSSAFDAYLYLLGPGGTVIASDDDGGGGSNSKIVYYVATTGTYTIEATTYSSGVTGAYTVSLNCVNGPPPPTNLTAKPGNAQVVLAWDASSGSPTYKIKRALVSGGPYTTIASGITTTGYTNVSLSNGTAYYYVVSAVNTYGESNNSNEATATPLAPTPVRVISCGQSLSGTLKITDNFSIGRGSGFYANQYTFTATAGKTVTISLTSSAFDAYLYLLGPGGTVIASDDNGGGGSNSKIVYYVATTGTYTIEATTYYSGDTGAYTGAYTVSLNCSTSLAMPPTLTAKPGNTQALLTWTASVGATSYNLYRANYTGGEDYTPYKTGLSSPSYTDIGLTNGTTYYYQVTAVNASGEGARSNEASAMPLSDPSLLTAIGASGHVALSWNASNYSTNYNLYRATTSGAEGNIPYISNIYGTSYIDTGVANGTTYYYQVTAVNATGESGRTNEASATPNPHSPFSIACGQTASGSLDATHDYSLNRSSCYADRYTFTATAGKTVTIALTSSDFDAYLYLLGPDGTVIASDDDGGGGGNSKIVYHVATTGTYTIEATTYSSGVTGAYTVSLNCVNGPLPPTNLTALGLNTMVKLNWTAIPGYTYSIIYNVKRSLTSGGPYTTIATGVSGTNYLDKGLTNGTKYYYVVAGIDALGEGINSNEASAIPNAILFSDNFNTSAQSYDLSFEYDLNVNAGGRQSGSLAPLPWYNASSTTTDIYTQINNASLGAPGALLLSPSQPNRPWVEANTIYSFSDYGVLDINFDVTLTTSRSPNATSNSWAGIRFDGQGYNTTTNGSNNGMGFRFSPTGKYSPFDGTQALPVGNFTVHSGTPYHVHIRINTPAFDGGSPVLFSLDIDSVHKFDYVLFRGMAKNYITLQAEVDSGSGANYNTIDNFSVSTVAP